MHNLILDIGNTNSKIAVFKGNEMVHYHVVPKLDEALLIDLIDRFAIQNSILSTVGADAGELVTILNTRTKYIAFTTKGGAEDGLFSEIDNQYKTPSTLGLDRWAKVISAHRLFPKQNCFMIDAGTCITYDLLNDKSQYFGGSISLGIGMRFASLHHFTKRLPLLKWDKDADIPIGVDTETAMQNGVLQGVINEVEGFIALQNEKYKGLKIVITGGDAGFLRKQLKNSIFAPQIIYDPYFVLKGLNEVIAFEYVQKN
ncbi:type III pantothenate kinase [Pedobacter sp. MC2016-14]|uniref:type III pantothenate kinase n=1 Tax=Pedobacter sp. MC2016-14 TaxID=2897327 RepID=UPI001E31482F|nr:type III pantothenate kinase [Pedobacter sp. MC2016-14]MCD0487558.1 type III pantothenate kinase [Pedobacter sp. MC2016-14]